MSTIRNFEPDAYKLLSQSTITIWNFSPDALQAAISVDRPIKLYLNELRSDY